MYKFFVILCCVLLTIVIFSCQSEQKAESEMQQQEKVTTAESDTSQVTCSACGMSMAKADMISHEIDGEMHYFCSEGCKDHFLAQQQEMEESEEPEMEEE